MNDLCNDNAQAEPTRIFVELIVRYPDPELCTYKEYKGKPYYSIKFIENGETHVGYSTYSIEVLSRYLKDYFMLPAPAEIIRCKDCRYWMPHSQLGFDEDNEEYHDYCEKLVPDDEFYAFYRNADDYCSRAERRTDDQN